MTPEAKVKQSVKRLLAQYMVYPYMPVQGRFGGRSIDFLICANGIYLAIETKTIGKQPTPEQHNTMRIIKASGGHVLVIDESTLWMLIDWLEWARRQPNHSGPHEYEPKELQITYLTGG